MLKKLFFGCFAFAVLAFMILQSPAWKLRDFDQIFYVTVAYDLDKHGVFSNGIFAAGDDSTIARPPPGMFFGPVYPALVFAAMKIDPRFAAAVRCSVEADRGYRDEASCEAYALPMRLISVFLLVIGLLAVAGAAEVILARKSAFFIAGLLALAALAAVRGYIFSYVMTESAIFALYSVLALLVLLAWKTGQRRYFICGGAVLGVLCLTKPSFVILFPVIAALSLLYGYRLAKERRPKTAACVLGFSLDTLVREHARLDPLIGSIALDEMRARWWRYLLVGIPLAWCGMWAGWVVSLVLLPAFVLACVRAFTTGQPLFLLYAAPAITMLALHAAVGNHYTRYNLILIGPYAVGAALIATAWWRRRRRHIVCAPFMRTRR